jgi:hypothetical protein
VSVCAVALFELAKKANATAPIDCAPAPPTPQVRFPGCIRRFWDTPRIADFSLSANSIHALAALQGGTDMCVCMSECPQVYLGEQYVNNATLSDVTFLVEDRKFYAHRIALLASSDTFRAMFDGHYKEKEASIIPIPNIRFSIFEAMMRCIYTGDHPRRPNFFVN